MNDKHFYLACLRDNVGGNIAFHGVGGCGYHTDVRKAALYSKEEAQRFWDHGRSFDLPLCKESLDGLEVFKVDCQIVPYKSTLEQGCDEYVAFAKGRFNGNDLYWLRLDGSTSTNFSEAKIFKRPDLDNESLVWLPWRMAHAAKRPTLDASLINRRTMIQGAGLLTPKHLKRASRSNHSGKTRWNCPGCGRISWQADPHEFHGCLRVECKEYSPTLR